ncbi:MAG TPA: GDSL-type esterase/lipase family protein [Solirubrobacterales bacterium]|nr:GDSL-type esterase/lipase family protein [Solirubrobacterales bacterium]
MLERYVMFCGDSHTVGAGDPDALGWAGRVAAAAIVAGVPLTSYNLGVRGQTSVEVAARWRAEVAPRLPDDGSDVRAVFAFGANDVSLRDGEPRCSREESLGALASALDGAEELGMRAFVVGPAAIDDEAANKRIVALSAAFAELCEEREVPFAPLAEELRRSHLWRQEMAVGDGAHPGAWGYIEIARLVLAAGWIDWLRA